jgi:hypothetical protein
MKFLTQTQHFMQVDRIAVERILSSENIFVKPFSISIETIKAAFL